MERERQTDKNTPYVERKINWLFMWIYRKRKIPTTLVVYVLGERERENLVNVDRERQRRK